MQRLDAVVVAPLSCGCGGSHILTLPMNVPLFYLYKCEVNHALTKISLFLTILSYTIVKYNRLKTGSIFYSVL